MTFPSHYVQGSDVNGDYEMLALCCYSHRKLVVVRHARCFNSNRVTKICVLWYADSVEDYSLNILLSHANVPFSMRYSVCIPMITRMIDRINARTRIGAPIMSVLLTMETTFSTPELQLFHQLFDYYSSDSSMESQTEDEDEELSEGGYESLATVL